MTVAQMFLNEFEYESKTTHKFLDRTPEDKLAWRPHEKSMTAGQLALHIAAAMGSIAELAQKNDVPMPDFGKPFAQPQNKGEIMAAFEKSVATVKRILPTFSDAAMQETWRFIKDGKPVME